MLRETKTEQGSFKGCLISMAVGGSIGGVIGFNIARSAIHGLPVAAGAVGAFGALIGFVVGMAAAGFVAFIMIHLLKKREEKQEEEERIEEEESESF